MMIRLRNTLSIAKTTLRRPQQSIFWRLFHAQSLFIRSCDREKPIPGLRLSYSSKSIISPSKNTIYFGEVTTRYYSTFNHSKAPTKEFLGSFLDHEYSKANSLIFDENERNEYLASLSQLTLAQVTQAASYFSKVVEATFEFPDKGFQFIIQFLKASPETEPLLDLKKNVVKEREKLLLLILHTGQYEVYENLILPLTQRFVPNHELTFLDKTMTILELQRSPAGPIRFNEQNVTSALRGDGMTIEEKRDLLKILVLNSLAVGDTFESRMSCIDTFVKYAKLIEGDGWFTSDISSQYDQVFQKIGIPSSEDEFDDYYQKVVKIVEKYHDTSVSYDFLTGIMRNLSMSAPFVTYRLFEFKSAQWRQRNLARKYVLNHLDLAYVMKACLKLDENKIYEIYLQNEDLHDDESQEAIFLDLCVQHKDWKSLQDRFENMYGKGNLPDTVHYGITMQALEFLEADSELERLYEQILDRGLMMNATIFIARMKAKIRQNNQTELMAIFEDYIFLVSQEKADRDGITQAFPFVLQIKLLEGANELILETLEKYLVREKSHQLLIVSGEALGIVASHFAQNCALKDLDRLFEMAKNFHKCDPEFASSLIQAYSTLGQYAKADDVAYLAHGLSSPPFSNLQVYSSQLKNHLLWRRQDNSRHIRRYNDIKVNFIVSLALQSEFSIFQSQVGGLDLLSAIMDSLRENAIELSRSNSLGYLKGRSVKTLQGLVKRQKAFKIRLDEKLYIPLLRQNLVYQSYKPLNVMKIFNEMNRQRVLVSAASYIHVMKAMRALDKRYDRSYKNSREMLEQMLQLYGFDAEKTKSNPNLDFKRDSVLICDIVIKYVESVGLKRGSDLFSRFVLFCEKAFDGKLPLDLRAKIDCFLSACYKEVDSAEYGEFLKQKFKVYQNILCEFVLDMGNEGGHVIIPHVLNEVLSHFTIHRMKYLLSNNKFDTDQEEDTLDVLEMGLRPNITDYNYVICYFLEQTPKAHFSKLLKIIEDNLITGNLSQLELYKEKKLCYKMCMVYLCDIYDEQTIAQNYKILSDYFGIKSLSTIRSQLKENGNLNLLKSSSGRLFNVKLDPYGSRSMNQFNFIEYFNPARDASAELRLLNEASRLLVNSVLQCCQGNKEAETVLCTTYPKIYAFYKSDLSYYTNLSEFNGKVDYLNSSQDTRLRKAKDVLRKLLFNHNNTKIFIPRTPKYLENVYNTSQLGPPN